MSRALGTLTRRCGYFASSAIRCLQFALLKIVGGAKEENMREVFKCDICANGIGTSSCWDQYIINGECSRFRPKKSTHDTKEACEQQATAQACQPQKDAASTH